MTTRRSPYLYLVTEGHPYDGEPSVLAMVRPGELHDVLTQLAKHRVEAGEDVTDVYVWRLTDGRIEPRGFSVVLDNVELPETDTGK